MTDQLSKAMEELQEKSAFVCASCGHPNDLTKVREKTSAKVDEGVQDRFSEAVEESGEKSAFVCESCGNPQAIPTSGKH